MKVFISYSSRDRLEALAVRRIAEECGGQTWMDVFNIQPSLQLQQELEQAIDESDTLCLLLSPTAVASRWVQTEIERARAAGRRGVRVLPIVLRPTRMPDALADLIAIDATRGIQEESVALRLRQFFGGAVPQGIQLDAVERASWADREARDKAEAALPALREELERVWDQPLRSLTLEVDQDTWPDDEGGFLEVVLKLDILKGEARVILAPYVEGGTWRPPFSFDESPPDSIETHRVDGRFSWAGRVLSLSATRGDVGELPITCSVELDGSEYRGDERASTLLLLQRFELPSLRELVDKASAIYLRKWPREGEAELVDPLNTDLDLRLTARVDHDAVREVCLWRSRHTPAEQVILEAPSLKSCATALEREVLLSAYHRRPLREQARARERRQRVAALLERQEPVPTEDAWLAANVVRSRAHLAAQRGQKQAAAGDYARSVDLMQQDFEPGRAGFAQYDALRNSTRHLAHLLNEHGTEEARTHFSDLLEQLGRAMIAAHPTEPEYRRRLAKDLLTLAELEQRRTQRCDAAKVDEAVALLDGLARERSDLRWRVAEAREAHETAGALRAPPPDAPAPPVYARWLDPRAASREVPTLCTSALPRFSAKVPNAVYGPKRLHLIEEELVAVYGGIEKEGWLAVNCGEPRGDSVFGLSKRTVLRGATFEALGLSSWSVVEWDDAKAGDLEERLEVKRVAAARVLLRNPESARLFRVYVVVAEDHRLRWSIMVGFAVSSSHVDSLVATDALAALAFRSLQLG